MPAPIDALIEQVRSEFGHLVARLVAEELSLAQWHRGMENVLRRNVLAAYTIGLDREPTRVEQRIIMRELNIQLGYLRRFYEDMKAERLSEGQIVVRAGMYADRLRGIEQLAETRNLGLKLPQVPGDCKTRCRTNCKCHLEYAEGEQNGEAVVEVRWIMDVRSEHCSDCEELHARWNPLIVRPDVAKGGPGSGNFGHEGIPGQVGGSMAGEGGMGGGGAER